MAKKLYFLAKLTPDKVKEAEDQGYCVRDASMYRPGDSIENCDEAAGDVPEAYKQFVKQKDSGAADDKEEDGNGSPKTVKEYQEALVQMGVEFPPTARKAELEALYNQHKQPDPLNLGGHHDHSAA
jgi:hypothetical protein